MNHRMRPPNRRPCVTRSIEWHGAGIPRFAVTIGLDPVSGNPLEVFYSDGLKGGSQLQYMTQDACCIISLALQHGAKPSEIRHSLSDSLVFGTTRPSSIIGVIAEEIARVKAHG